MKGNDTLADYDMVLALSENTINYQFKQLYKRNIIHKKWGVLGGKTTGDRDFIIRDTDDAFKDKFKDWVAIQNEIAKAKQDKNWGEFGHLLVSVKTKNLNFSYAWDAIIDPPTICLIKNDPKNVYLTISFKSGKLFFRKEETSKVASFDVEGTKYVFKVPIGQLKINKDQMLLEAGESTKKVIRDSGLSDSDFTIEGLFLNFENANISDFDKNKSAFPEEAALEFQIAIENYFKITLKDSENPYVLGYGVSRRKIKASEKAMFQPTALSFSTSYSNHLKKPGIFSAFNFLMMLNDTKLPTNPRSGILPQSLIELEKDISSTVDGVFAIQKTHFNKYIKSLDEYVQKTFTDLEGVKLKSGFKDGVMKLYKNDKKDGNSIQTKYTVTRKAIEDKENKSKLFIRYKIEVSVKAIIKILGIEVKEVKLSTSGKYTKDKVNKKGKPGYLDFIIKVGKTGRFDLEHELNQPAIAYEENPNYYEGDFWKVFLNVLKTILSLVFVIIDAIVNQLAVDLGKAGAVSSGSLIAKLNDISVLNQTNKVILPLGRVYSFKNLRIEKEQNIVAYDISYAPVNKKQN